MDFDECDVLNDLRQINSRDALIEFLRKLKYEVIDQPLSPKKLELPDNYTKFIQKVYLLIKLHKDRYKFECFLFEVNTSISKSSVEHYDAHKWMRDISRGLYRTRRDIYYLFFCTNNYRQLLIGSPKLNSDKTDISLSYHVIDCINPTTHDLNCLKKLTIGNFQDPEDLHKLQYKALQNISEIKKAERKGVPSEDSLGIYLREIGRIRLLRADEEIELAYKIADINKLEQEREELWYQLHRDPEDSEWAEAVQLSLSALRDRLHIGRKAKDKMIQSHLRLVVSIAKRYQGRGMELQDLIQEGNLGLIHAAQNFKPQGRAKFSSYAYKCIRGCIIGSIYDQSRIIRLSCDVYKNIFKIKNTIQRLTQEIGHKPTEEQIATQMEISIKELRFIIKSAKSTLSLDVPINSEEGQEGSCIGDFIEFDGATPEEWVTKNLLREDLMEVLGTLSVRERNVIRLNYGLDDGQMKTFEEIGRLFNVTRERIRQIQEKALRKLRQPNRNSVLKEYIR